MTLLKRKKKFPPLLEPPRWHERARATITQHPITIGAAASFVVAIYPLVQWVDAHYQTRADAVRAMAWTQKALADQQVLVLRNRVNDCGVRREQGGAMTPIEKAACQQYDDEFQAAVRRADEALRAAKAASQ